MKRILLPIIMLSAFISNNAFAKHAYRSEVCKSKTHKLFYKGNYPIGGDYGIKLLKDESDEDVTALPIEDETEADVVFKEKFSMNISRVKSSDDCDFDHKEWKSLKIINFANVSKEAAKKLGLKPGQNMKFICEETTDHPSSKECEEE